MATSNSVTTFAGGLKTWYGKKMLEVGSMKTKPFYGMVKKDPSGGGKGWSRSLQNALPTGGSKTFGSGSLNSIAATIPEFTSTTWKEENMPALLDHQVIMVSRRTPELAYEPARKQLDLYVERVKQKISLGCFRPTSGEIGRIASVSNGTASFNDDSIGTAQFLQPNDEVVYSSTAGDVTTKRGAGNTSCTVTIKNEDLGTFATSSADNAAAAGQANDYVYFAGDINRGMAGWPTWIPDTAPVGSLFGVDRTSDPVGLGGVRLPALGLTVEETCIELCDRVVAVGGSPDAVFVHPRTFSRLAKELSGRVRYMSSPGQGFDRKPASISFKGIEVNTSEGPVPVFRDPAVGVEHIYCATMSTWELLSSNDAPHFMGEDGLDIIRDTSGATPFYRADLLSYHELVCMAPRWNGVAILNSAS